MARTNLKVTDGIAIDFYDDGNSNKGSIYLDNGAFVFSGTSGGDVVIGEVGNGADLVFEESSTIHGQGGNTLTFGQSGDSLIFAVDSTFNANIDFDTMTTSASSATIKNELTNGDISFWAKGSDGISDEYLRFDGGNQYIEIYKTLDLNNVNLVGANSITINDPGVNEGLIFNGSAGTIQFHVVDDTLDNIIQLYSNGSTTNLFELINASATGNFDMQIQTNANFYMGDSQETSLKYDNSYLRVNAPEIWIDAEAGSIILDAGNNIVMRDEDDDNETLFDLDTTNRTLKIGATDGLDDITTTFYGQLNVSDANGGGAVELTHTNTSFVAGSKATIKLTSADQHVYISSNRSQANAGANLEFDVTNSSGVRVPGMIINEAADIRFHEGVYIGAGADSGNTDHIRLLASSTLFNRDAKFRDDVYINGGTDSSTARIYFQHDETTADQFIMYKQDNDFNIQSEGNQPIYFRFKNATTTELQYAFADTTFTIGQSSRNVDTTMYGNLIVSDDATFQGGNYGIYMNKTGDNNSIRLDSATSYWSYIRFESGSDLFDIGIRDTQDNGAFQIRHNGNNNRATLFYTDGSMTLQSIEGGANRELVYRMIANQYANGTTDYDTRMNLGLYTTSTDVYAYLSAPVHASTGSIEMIRFYDSHTEFHDEIRLSATLGDSDYLKFYKQSTAAGINVLGGDDLVLQADSETYLELDNSANVLNSYKQTEFKNHVGIADGYDLYIRGNAFNEGIHLYDGSSPTFTYSVVTSTAAVGRHSSTANGLAYMYNYPVGNGYYGNNSTTAYHMAVFAADYLYYDISSSAFSGMQRMEELENLAKDKKVFGLHNPYMSDVNIEISEALARIKRLERELLKEKNINKDYQQRLARLEDLISI